SSGGSQIPSRRAADSPERTAAPWPWIVDATAIAAASTVGGQGTGSPENGSADRDPAAGRGSSSRTPASSISAGNGPGRPLTVSRTSCSAVVVVRDSRAPIEGAAPPGTRQ